MSVTEIKQAIGSWNLTLSEQTPVTLLDQLTFYGHIALLPGQVDVAQYGDNLLSAARYVGVFRGRDQQNKFKLKGSGMAFWLGDEDNKGDILESPVTISGATFPNTIRALLPPGGSITEGTLYSVPGTYTGRHQWVTPREAITYVTDLFGAEFRVNNDGTLDAGLISDLYVTVPKTLILRKGFGSDLFRTAIPGEQSMGIDVEDTTTRVVLLAEGEGTSIVTAAANAPVTPYKDIHGNPIKATRLVSESGTEAGNAAARAQLQLNRFLNPRRAVDLSTSEYDVKGTFIVGDYVDVYDPVNSFYDANREIYWNGERINPMALRCVEMTWPIPPGWTVAFRTVNGVWIDLTPYYVPETGDTTIVVGELARGLASVGGEPVGVRPNLPDNEPPGPDSTIPATPAFTGFSTGSYESDDHTLAAIYMQWNTPLNQDGSTITDGDHYEIRYRPNQVIGTATPWDFLAGGYDVDGEELFTTPIVSGGWGAQWTSMGSTSTAELSVANGEGRITHPTFNILRGVQFGTSDWSDVEILACRKIDYVPSGASTVMGVVARRVGSDYYWVRVEPNVDSSVTVKLSKQHSGYQELIVYKIPEMVHTSGVQYWIRASFIGNAIAIKVWQGTIEDEPERDTVNTLDLNPLSAAGKIGIWDWIVNGATNPAGSMTKTTYFQVRSLVPDNTANAYSWDDLGTWDALTTEPVTITPSWTTAFVGWDQNAFTLNELGPGVQYEIQIRAVDTSANFSPWSTPSEFVNTSGDAIAPSTPAPPEVAASMIAVQVIHRLGKATGGTFNLEQDLHHFDVHASYSPTFYPEAATKVGELFASGAMIRSGIPAIGSFKVDQPNDVYIRVVAVDRTGNKSAPSDAVHSTVVLIDDAHISNLSVSKLTAGTITANTVLAAEMEVASGGNIKLTEGSLDVFDNLGVQQIEIGKLSDNTYGLAAIGPSGELGKLSDLIFGPKADRVSFTDECTTVGSWTDLAHAGPSVTVDIGESGLAIVFISAYFDYNGNGVQGGGLMSFEATGANSISPSDFRTVRSVFSISAGSYIIGDRKTATIVLTGLNAGTTTFTAKYQKFNAGTLNFLDREIAVFPY